MNYSPYRNKAAEKIRQYGAKCEIVRGGKKYDPATDEYSDAEAFSGYAIQSSFSMSKVDGTNIKAGDILLMAALDGKPCVNDTVRYGGRSYAAVNVIPFAPDGGDAIYWKIQAR